MRSVKLTALFAAALIAVSAFTSCGDSNSSSAPSSSAAETVSSVTTEAEPSSEAEAPAADLARSGEVRDLSAAELVAEMTTGWNLGNSLDVFGKSGTAAEVAWGNPKTTKEMIDAVVGKGFDIIRVPVTWGDHVDEQNKIDEAWMSRVQEVVNYVYDSGAYVILNSHHEEAWRITDNAHIEEVDKKTAEIWAQIAERFKDYGDHLIFEGLNEPRVKGSKEEWTGGTEEGRACVNRLNKTFIDTVRATGGNNQNRLLLLTTYASACSSKAIKDAELPTGDKHLGFSIHAYTPYAFTYKSGESWELFKWDGSHDSEILGMMYDLKETFIDNGFPVIITEYGAVNKDGNDEEVAKWAASYLETAKTVGIPCVWWDNGYYTSGNELFGIFNRKTCQWYTETVVDTLIKSSAKS